MAQTHEDFSRVHHVEAATNRSFGSVFTAVFLVIALWPLFSGRAPRWWSLAVSGVMLLITLAAPASLTLPNRLWLRVGVLLNRIISPVVLAFLFYAVVAPMGLLMRALGKDTLRLRKRDPAQSYWIKRDPPGPKPDSMSDQF